MRNRNKKGLVVLGTPALISRAFANIILAHDWVQKNKCFETNAALVDAVKELAAIKENSMEFKNFYQKALATKDFFAQNKGDCSKHEPKILALKEEIQNLKFQSEKKKANVKKRRLVEA